MADSARIFERMVGKHVFRREKRNDYIALF